MRRSARLQKKQESKSSALPPTKMSPSLSKSSTPPEKPAPEPTPFGALYKLPTELRLMVWEFAVNGEQGGVVNFHQPCHHFYSRLILSKATYGEMKPIIERADDLICKHTDFQIILPNLHDMPAQPYRKKLLRAIQERDGLGARAHDITQADTLVFHTAHLSNNAPDAVICYLERGYDYFSWDIEGGSDLRRAHVESELLEAMNEVKNRLRDNATVDVEREDDGIDDPIARLKRLQMEAITYLAESVRVAVCEHLHEEVPRFLGPGRGIRYGF